VEDDEQPLIPLAAPGETVDVSVKIKMPEKPGRYTGYYRLCNGTDDAFFGHRFWLDVLVSEAVSPTETNPQKSGPVKQVFDKALDVVAKVWKGEKGSAKENKEGDHAKSKKPETSPQKFEFEDQLSQLKGMGFTDESKLKQLLVKFKGNVQRVADKMIAE